MFNRFGVTIRPRPETVNDKNHEWVGENNKNAQRRTRTNTLHNRHGEYRILKGEPHVRTHYCAVVLKGRNRWPTAAEAVPQDSQDTGGGGRRFTGFLPRHPSPLINGRPDAVRAILVDYRVYTCGGSWKRTAAAATGLRRHENTENSMLSRNFRVALGWYSSCVHTSSPERDNARRTYTGPVRRSLKRNIIFDKIYLFHISVCKLNNN